MQVFGLPGHLIRRAGLASRLIAVKASPENSTSIKRSGSHPVSCVLNPDNRLTKLYEHRIIRHGTARKTDGPFVAGLSRRFEHVREKSEIEGTHARR